MYENNRLEGIIKAVTKTILAIHSNPSIELNYSETGVKVSSLAIACTGALLPAIKSLSAV